LFPPVYELHLFPPIPHHRFQHLLVQTQIGRQPLQPPVLIVALIFSTVRMTANSIEADRKGQRYRA